MLRELSSELQAKTNILVFASMLLVIAKALFSHVRLVANNFSKLFHVTPTTRFSLLLSCPMVGFSGEISIKK